MVDEIPNLTSRRNVLKGIGAAAVIGAGGLALTGGASASSHLNISDSSVSNDTGDITEVNVELSHTTTWSGFDIPVEAVEYYDEIEVIGPDGTSLGTYTLRDGTDTPVMLSNWSSDGDGSDGWGGPDEHTSGAGTTGDVNAGILWTILADDPSSPTNPIPAGTPAGTADYTMDNDEDGSDGTTDTYTIIHTKEVHFYTTEDISSAETTYQSDDGTTVRKLGYDDGTKEKSVGSGSFDVSVTNEESTDSSSGSGDSTSS